MSFIQVQRVRDVLTVLKQKDRLDAIDEITYHPYYLRPEEAYPLVEELRAAIATFSTEIVIRNGEDGAPAEQHNGGVLRQHPWTETSQSKWALRRLLGDLGRNIESSHFALIDMKYPFKWVPADQTHVETNRKEVKDFSEGNYTMYTYGAVAANVDKTAKGPRQLYFSLQYLSSIFDHTLEVMDTYPYTISTDKSVSFFAFENGFSGKQIVSYWFDADIPSDKNAKTSIDLEMIDGYFDEPVLVDLRTGEVFDIPASLWSRSGTMYRFNSIPCYDSPMLIADKSLLQIMK
jgi:hypothetical protein